MRAAMTQVNNVSASRNDCSRVESRCAERRRASSFAKKNVYKETTKMEECIHTDGVTPRSTDLKNALAGYDRVNKSGLWFMTKHR